MLDPERTGNMIEDLAAIADPLGPLGMVLPKGAALLSGDSLAVMSAHPVFAQAVGIPLAKLVDRPFPAADIPLVDEVVRAMIGRAAAGERAFAVTDLPGADRYLYSMVGLPLERPEGGTNLLLGLLRAGHAGGPNERPRCGQTCEQLGLLQQMPQGLAVLNREGRVACCNSHARSLLVTDGEVLMLPPLWRLDGSLYPEAEGIVQRALAGEPTIREELYIRRNGVVLTARVSTVLLSDRRGQVHHTLVALQDLTKQRFNQRRLARALEAERRRTAEVETLYSVGKALSQSLEMQECLQVAAASLAGAIGARRCVIFQLGGGKLRLAADYGLSDSDRKSMLRDTTDLCDANEATRIAISTGQPLVIQDAESDPRLDGRARQFGVRSLLIVPLASQGQVSAIAFLDRPGKSRMFFSSQIRLASAIATQAGVALDHARLYRLEHEKSTLLASMISELNHRVKNSLAIVAGLLSLQAMDPRLDGKSRALLRNTITRIQSVAVIHQLLHEEQLPMVEMCETIKRITGVVGQAFCPNGEVRFEVSGDPLMVPSKLATSLGVAVNELLCNALRHGLAGRRDGLVETQLSVGPDRITVRVRDNGRGLSPGFDPSVHQGTGGMIVQGLMERELEGTFSLTNHPEGGTVAILEFGRDRVDVATAEQLAAGYNGLVKDTPGSD